MDRRILPSGVVAALAGAGALLMTSAPASAFTLSSPSFDQTVAGGGVEKVWWDNWGRWHPNHPWGWRRWGWGPPPPRYGFYAYGGPVRHCWRGPWGGLHCRWW